MSQLSTPLLSVPDLENKSTSTEQSLLNAFLDTVVDGIVCIDSDGLLKMFNRSAEEIFGYSAEEVVGKNVSMLMPERFAATHHMFIRDYEIKGGSNVIGRDREIKGRRKDGTEFPIEIAIGEAVIDNQRVYTGIIRDITERKKAEAEIEQYREHLEDLVHKRTQQIEEANFKLRELASKDSLTQLFNRRYFTEIFHREIGHAKRHGKKLSFLMCDIDFFKAYNDHYGHLAGDKCLKKVAECIAMTFRRATDVCVRYGGEEFVVILPDTDKKKAQELAENLRQAIMALKIPHEYSGVSDVVTLSIGCICIDSDMLQSKNDKDFIQFADEALYRAKNNGRNRVEMVE